MTKDEIEALIARLEAREVRISDQNASYTVPDVAAREAASALRSMSARIEALEMQWAGAESEIKAREAREARLREALGETVRVLTFAFDEGALPEDIVLGLCVDPYGMLADARAALSGEGGGEADSDGWIPWHGGKCPVQDGTLVEARLASPALTNGKALLLLAERLRWRTSQPAMDDDVIAYRVVHRDKGDQP